MKIKLVTIDILDTQQQERELNAFLASHSIFALTRELVRFDDRAYWAFCIEYGEPGSPAPLRSQQRTHYHTVPCQKRLAGTSV